MTRRQPENEDYRWLSDALGGIGHGAPHRALVRPSADHPELFIPLGPPAAAAAALHRFHDGRRNGERMQSLAAMVIARLGLLRFAPGECVEIGPFATIERLLEELREPAVHLAITLGPRRRNRKPVLQLLRGDGTVIGFAKVGWSPFTRELVANEADWLERLEGKTPPGIEIPTVLARLDEPDRLVVVTSPLRTSPRAGRDGTLPNDTIVDLARALGTEHVKFRELTMLSELRTGRVGELIDVDRLVDRHGDAEVELGLWHGDLTPWNTSTTDGASLIWDWEFAADERPTGFDLLHTSFELVRRSQGATAADGLAAVQDRCEAALAWFGQPADAVFDLYMCELIQREARLRGEGWDPADLAPLEQHAADMLQRRLR